MQSTSVSNVAYGLILKSDNINATWPNLIVYGNQQKTARILDVECIWEPLIIEREEEKFFKYLPLTADLGNRTKVKLVPIVIGALGTVPWATSAGDICSAIK